MYIYHLIRYFKVILLRDRVALHDIVVMYEDSSIGDSLVHDVLLCEKV